MPQVTYELKSPIYSINSTVLNQMSLWTFVSKVYVILSNMCAVWSFLGNFELTIPQKANTVVFSHCIYMEEFQFQLRYLWLSLMLCCTKIFKNKTDFSIRIYNKVVFVLYFSHDGPYYLYWFSHCFLRKECESVQNLDSSDIKLFMKDSHELSFAFSASWRN